MKPHACATRAMISISLKVNGAVGARVRKQSRIPTEHFWPSFEHMRKRTPSENCQLAIFQPRTAEGPALQVSGDDLEVSAHAMDGVIPTCRMVRHSPIPS